ncbi:hypothetical protein L3Q82_020944 [Scortum barcoo]|uniref:Uncharacterized protein n=1 Tax=Scortum barcoo TaxID=214431 RepID=A0ACB8V983_9TELE|nr:hypothetical protein L3Q82_020944 [Scortum barcoo]
MPPPSPWQQKGGSCESLGGPLNLWCYSQLLKHLSLAIDPFGLQHMAFDTLKSFLHKSCGHYAHVRQVLIRLLENQLYVKAEKRGSQNTKTDALSHLYDPEPAAKEPEPILPPDRVVGVVTWQIENYVQRASQGKPAPEGCPRNQYIAACSVCARSKASRQVRMGLLPATTGATQTLVTSLVGLGTGLPPSRGNTVVLTVVGQFSKMTHFISLTKLPTAKETATVMINHVFRIHGLPTETLSLTEDHSLYPVSGRSFVSSSVPPSAYPPPA